MLELRIVGPQFGEPSILMRWLSHRYGATLQIRQLSDVDAVLELSATSAGVPFHVIASRPATWDRALVDDFLFAQADAVGIVFTRIAQLLHLNRAELQALRPRLAHLPQPIALLANDARCGHPDFPAVSAAAVSADLGIEVRGAAIGPFFGNFSSVDGAESFWAEMLTAAGAPRPIVP